MSQHQAHGRATPALLQVSTCVNQCRTQSHSISLKWAMGFLACQKASNFPYSPLCEGLGLHFSGIPYAEVKHGSSLVLKLNYKINLRYLPLSPLDRGVDQGAGDAVRQLWLSMEGEKEQLCF